MKKFYLLISIILSAVENGNAQTSYESKWPCNEAKYDTITTDFIAEVNANYLFYRVGDAIVQNNMVYINRASEKDIYEQLYATDTIICHFGELLDYLKNNKICIDQESTGEFYRKVTSAFVDKKNKRKFLKATVESNGIKYLKFTATLIVSNIGARNWMYPLVFCKYKSGSLKEKKHCDKVFENTLLIVSVLDFKYR